MVGCVVGRYGAAQRVACQVPALVAAGVARVVHKVADGIHAKEGQVKRHLHQEAVDV